MKNFIYTSLFITSLLFAKDLPILDTNITNVSSYIKPSGIAYSPNYNALYLSSNNGDFCSLNTLKKNKQTCTNKTKTNFEELTFDLFYSQNFIYGLSSNGKENSIVYFNKQGDKLSDIKINKNLSLNSLAYHKTIGDDDFFYGANKNSIFYIRHTMSCMLKDGRCAAIGKVDKNFNINISNINGITAYNGYLFALKNNSILVLQNKNKTLRIIDSFNTPGFGNNGISIWKDNIYLSQDNGNILKLKINIDKFKYMNINTELDTFEGFTKKNNDFYGIQ